MGLAKAIGNVFSKTQVGKDLNVVKGMKDLTRNQRYKLSKKIINKGFKQGLRRSATVAAVAKSAAEAKEATAKYNYQNYQDALDKYNKIIANKPEPAEGTGEPESGESSSEGVQPVGN